MVITLNDWVFDVNVDATMEYSNSITKDYCQCGYCRNFRSAAHTSYPGVHDLLRKFGNQISTPEELMPFEPTVYEGSYCISGTILQRGQQPIHYGQCRIWVLSQSETDYETECESPYFVLRSEALELPWVLDEDMDEVISPANEPEYLQRMWSRLLESAADTQLHS